MLTFIVMFAYVAVMGLLSRWVIMEYRISLSYDSGVNKTFIVIIAALPVFLIGMRTGVGDTQVYINAYNRFNYKLVDIARIAFTSRGSGWKLYEWLARNLVSTNVNVFLMITAAVQFFAVTRIYYLYSSDFQLSFLLFFLSFAFMNALNGLRQFLAVSVVLLGSRWMFERDYTRFVVLVLAATMIHISALIWLPCVFLVQGKPWNPKMLLASLLIILSIVFVEEFTGFLEDSLADTSYEGYTEQFAKDDGANIMHTLIAAVPVMIAFLGRKLVERKGDRKLNVMINIAVLGMMVSLLSHFTSGILVGRMPIYFTVFNYALLPRLFEIVFAKNSQKLMRFLCIVGYSLFALYYLRATGVRYISEPLGIGL